MQRLILVPCLMTPRYEAGTPQCSAQSFWLSEPAFKKAAEAHIPPVCHLSCQECAKNKSLYTCSDGWSCPSPHVSETKAFCSLWSVIRWNCLLWMARIFLRVIIGKGRLVPTP